MYFFNKYWITSFKYFILFSFQAISEYALKVVELYSLYTGNENSPPRIATRLAQITNREQVLLHYFCNKLFLHTVVFN